MSKVYNVKLSRAADRDMTRLKALKGKVGVELKALKTNPHAGHILTGSLQGARGLEFSLPGGQYRAAYVIQEDIPRADDPNETESFCLVFMVGPHENFYREAERRLKVLRQRGVL